MAADCAARAEALLAASRARREAFTRAEQQLVAAAAAMAEGAP